MTDHRSTDTPAHDAEDTALGRSGRGPQGYEIQPDVSSDPAETDETGEEAAAEVERLEGHSRPLREPGEPDAT